MDEEFPALPEWNQQPGEAAQEWQHRLTHLDKSTFTEAQHLALGRVLDRCAREVQAEKRRQQREGREAEQEYLPLRAAWDAATPRARARLRQEIIDGKLT
jgi:hypothetical protein